MRIRDLGGLVVIDFIDMGPQRNQREVENRLREAVRQDRARVQIGRISRFGLLELSRQRLRPSLGESTHEVCPRCNGIGHVRGVESLALSILRLVGEEARKERTSKVITQLPVDVCNYVLNEKRDWVNAIQDRDDVQVVLVANPQLETPNYMIRRVRDDEVGAAENAATSYKIVETDADMSEQFVSAAAGAAVPEQPAIKGLVPSQPALPPPARKPAQEKAAEVSLFRRLFGWLLPEPGRPKKRGRRPGSQARKGGGQPQRRRSDADKRGRGDGKGRAGNQKSAAKQAPKGGQQSGQKGQPKGQREGAQQRKQAAEGGRSSRGRRGGRRRRGGRGGQAQDGRGKAADSQHQPGQGPTTETARVDAAAQSAPQQGDAPASASGNGSERPAAAPGPSSKASTAGPAATPHVATPEPKQPAAPRQENKAPPTAAAKSEPQPAPAGAAAAEPAKAPPSQSENVSRGSTE